MLWSRNVGIGLACGAMLALTACGGSSKPTTLAGPGATIAPSGPKAEALLVIADPHATKAALTEALSQASVKKYSLTSLSMDPASFDGLHFTGEKIWGTELTPPSADAAALNTAYQHAYGNTATDAPGLLRHGRDVNYIGSSGPVDLDANDEIARTSVQNVARA